MDMIENGDGTRQAAPGGGPFNTARALARLGVPTAFLGHLSTDRFGGELAALLREDGASLEMATYGPEPTTIAVADVDSEGLAEYQFLVDGTSAPNLTREMVPRDLGPAVDAIHIGTLGLALEPMAPTLVELAERERGQRLVMVDPNVRLGLGDPDDYRTRLQRAIEASSVVKASDADLAWLYPNAGYEEAADLILGEGVCAVVVTLGAEGAYGANGHVRVRVPARQVEVVDTIGAGDAFGAALLAWLHEHRCMDPHPDLEEGELRAALEFACLAAAITCTRAGADPPHRWEMTEASGLPD